MDKGTEDLKLLRRKFEKSIDREVIESVFNTVAKNYNNAHGILMDMLKTTENYEINVENIPMANGIRSKPNNTRNASKVTGSPIKDDSNNNSSKHRNPSKKEIAINETIQLIKSGSKVMVLLRGIPGSGKSYLAKQIVQETYGTSNFSEYVFSADDFFSRSGRYIYVREQISDAHAWNQNRVYWNVRNGLSPIIVDNTNIKIWEMKVYAQMAVEQGYYVNVLEPSTPWAFNHHELAKRNQHNVPRDKIRDMLDNYDHNIVTGKLLATFGLRYSSDMQPPQQRLRPPLDVAMDNRDRRKDELADVVREVKTTDKNVSNLVDLDAIPLPPAPMPSTSKKTILNTQENLHAWGLSENDINSWNMVATIKDDVRKIDINKARTSLQALPVDNKLVFQDVATNTSSFDFAIAQSGVQNGVDSIKSAYSRDINEGAFSSKPTQRKNGSRVTTFEKGIMTISDIDNDVPNDDRGLATLRNLFSDIPLEYLRDVYEKCQRNTNWAVDLLLDDNREIIPPVSIAPVDNNPPSHATSDSDNESTSPNPMGSVEIIELMDDSSTSGYEPSPKHNKFSGNEIKKHIESVVTIGGKFYSEHVRNLKSFREGFSSQQNLNAIPGPSNVVDSDKISNQQMDSDMDIDDFEMEQVMKMSPAVMDNIEDFVELNLGDGLVRQLETQFGDPHLIYPDGLLPTVQVPISFARQLHAFYLESVFEQLENQQAVYEELCKEDEAYATKLQAEEIKKLEEMREKQAQASTNTVPQLAEIMQEQAAQKDYYQTKLSADDLASRLTRQKLFNNFPSVGEETMLDIFAAHDNNYVKTVQVLLNTGLTIVNNDEFPLRPPVEDQVVTEMKQAEENLKQNKQRHDLEIVHSADEYRQLALRHGARRNELMSRAQVYHRRGMGPVAMFYSRLAREESDLFDQTNARAAECFLQEHSSRIEKFDTIDLHYLQAKEVVPALDIFLDRHINLLHGPNTKRTETLYVITGRGKHSRGGVSVIRPIAMNRLAKRQIGYTLMNPGLLQITVNHNSPITSDLR